MIRKLMQKAESNDTQGSNGESMNQRAPDKNSSITQIMRSFLPLRKLSLQLVLAIPLTLVMLSPTARGESGAGSVGTCEDCQLKYGGETNAFIRYAGGLVQPVFNVFSSTPAPNGGQAMNLVSSVLNEKDIDYIQTWLIGCGFDYSYTQKALTTEDLMNCDFAPQGFPVDERLKINVVFSTMVQENFGGKILIKELWDIVNCLINHLPGMICADDFSEPSDDQEIILLPEDDHTSKATVPVPKTKKSN